MRIPSVAYPAAPHHPSIVVAAPCAGQQGTCIQLPEDVFLQVLVHKDVGRHKARPLQWMRGAVRLGRAMLGMRIRDASQPLFEAPSDCNHRIVLRYRRASFSLPISSFSNYPPTFFFSRARPLMAVSNLTQQRHSNNRYLLFRLSLSPKGVDLSLTPVWASEARTDWGYQMPLISQPRRG